MRGFFVAKSFTKDAVAQAEKDSRLTLLSVEDYPVEELPVPFGFHVFEHHSTHVQVLLRQRGVGSEHEMLTLDISTAEVTLDDEVLDLPKYVQEWADSAIPKTLNSFPSGITPAGDHQALGSEERHFESDRLKVNGIDMELIRLEITAEVTIQRPPVTSYFEVESRGRAVSLGQVKTATGVKLDVTIATT